MEYGEHPQKFHVCVVNELDKKPITYSGEWGIDHDADSRDPDPIDMVRYQMKKAIWERFPDTLDYDEDDDEDESPESLPVDDSFRIQDPQELIQIMLFVAAAEGMRNKKEDIVKRLSNSNKGTVEYAHPLLSQVSKRLGVSLQVSPVPHPIRDYHGPCLLL